LTGDKYFYYVTEVKPLLRQLAYKGKSDDELWNEMLEFIYYAHNLEAGERFYY